MSLIPPQQATYSVGRTYGPNESDMYTAGVYVAGINVGPHGNAIEFYSLNEADAVARRDYVLSLIRADQLGEVPP